MPLSYLQERMKNVLILVFLISSQIAFSQCIEGDCFTGYGKFKCDCGYVFEGEFKDGERITGTLTKSDLVYTGEFKYDLAHGYGIIKYIDGSWYEGTFQENVPVGYGTYFLSNTQKYIGEIDNSEFKGLGTLFFTDSLGSFSQTEMGVFKEDVLNGIGFVQGKDGAMFLGYFKEGKKLGLGIACNTQSKKVTIGNYKKKGVNYTDVQINKPEKGDFQVEKFEIKKNYYSVYGDLNGAFIRLESYILNTLSQLVIVDQTNNLFYVSNKGTPQIGRAINDKGEIFGASIDSGPSNNIVVGPQLFKR